VRSPFNRSRRRRGFARLSIVALAVAGSAAMAGCDLTEDADLERGRALFQQKCGTCHALAEAGTTAQVGPDLDASFAQARADGMDNDTIEGVVQTQIENPRYIEEGAQNYDKVYMPANIVEGQDAEDVSAYIASVAGVPGAKPPQLAPPELFAERCGACHTLAEAGTAGTTGPNLDEVLTGKDAAYIREQIIAPDSEITPGYSAGVMPQDFEQTLSPEELKGLVDYLVKSVNGGGGGGQ
jgi:mono/diheme cytochrome c family protein